MLSRAELPALESFLSSRKELAGKVYAAKVHAKAAVDLSSDDDDVAPAKGGDGDEDEDSSEDSGGWSPSSLLLLLISVAVGLVSRSIGGCRRAVHCCVRVHLRALRMIPLLCGRAPRF